MRAVLLLGTASAAAFTDSDRFERWSHFKDYGIPGTVTDPLNQAAIADGSCRLLEGSNFDGFDFWRNPVRTRRVLNALNATPSTGGPSNFTLTAAADLSTACAPSSDDPPPVNDTGFTVTARAASMDNWYRAICAPSSSPVWSGHYDPAYMPQQQALTTGLLCIAGCEASRFMPSASAMSALAASPGGKVAQVCDNYPWDEGRWPRFGGANNTMQLAALSDGLVGPCACAPAAALTLSSRWPVYTVGGVAVMLTLSALVFLFLKNSTAARQTVSAMGGGDPQDLFCYKVVEDGATSAEG